MELKNDLAITGTLHSVDQYLNIKLNNIRVVNEQKYPHMLSVRAGNQLWWHCAPAGSWGPCTVEGRWLPRRARC